MNRVKTDADLFFVAKGGAIIFVGIVLENLLRLPMGIVLARVLGPEHLGLYHITISAALILSSVVVLGFTIVFVRYIPLYRTRCDLAGLSGLVRMGIALPSVAAVAVGFGLYAAAPFIAHGLFQEPMLELLLKMAAFIFPVWAVVSIGEAMLRGDQKLYHFTAANKVCTPLVRCLLVVVLAFFGHLSIGTAISAFGVSLLCTALLIVFFTHRQVAMDLTGASPRYDVKEIFRFALPAHGANLLLLIGPNSKLLLLGFLGTTADVGIFGPVTELSSLAALAFTAISMSAAPRIAQLHTQGNIDRLTEFYRTSSKWIFAISLPLCLIIFLYPEPLLMMFGQRFLVGATALRIMAMAGLVNVVMGMTQVYITMTGKSAVKLVNTVIFYAVMFGMDLFMIPRYGLLGAAISTLAASLLVGLLYFLQMLILYRMQPFNCQYLKPVMAGVLTIVIVSLSKLFYPVASSFILSVVSMILFLIVYAALLVAFGLSEQDRHFVAACFSAVKERRYGNKVAAAANRSSKPK